MKDTAYEVVVKNLNYSNYFLWGSVHSQNFPHGLAMYGIKSLSDFDEITIYS